MKKLILASASAIALFGLAACSDTDNTTTQTIPEPAQDAPAAPPATEPSAAPTAPADTAPAEENAAPTEPAPTEPAPKPVQ
jgi:hypothetical protein